MMSFHLRPRKALSSYLGIPAATAVIILMILIQFPARGQSPGGGGSNSVPLFVAAGVEHPGFDAVAPQARRYRQVQINPAVFRPAGIAIGDHLYIKLFEYKSVSATIDRISTDVNGVLAVRGRVDGREGGFILLSSDNGIALGELNIPDEKVEYAITYIARRNIQILQEMDHKLRGELEDEPPLIPQTSERPAVVPPFVISPEAALVSTRIDVMIVYTANARDWAAESGGIYLVISQAIERGQLSLENSNTEVSIRLAYSNLVDYTESGAPITDLSRLTDNGDGYMDVIHSWRETYGADLVQLFARVEDTGGVGWLLNTTAGLPHYAFSLARVQQAGWTYAVIHEIGHNMGCHHRKDQERQPGPGLFSYSAGWRWLGSDGNRYCSIMSYQDTWSGASVMQVPYFSNPSISYKDAATGDAADGDNSRTIREIKHVIAGYRTEACYNMLTLDTTTGGTTSPSPGIYAHLTGTVVKVTALPNTHYRFLNWSGDASDSANPLSVTLNQDKFITANFQRIIYPPLDAAGQKVLNRSLSQAEHINVLTWKTHPDNVNITNYKLYQIDGSQKTLIATLGVNEFKYEQRKAEKGKQYTYWLAAVNNEPREGDPAIVVIH